MAFSAGTRSSFLRFLLYMAGTFVVVFIVQVSVDDKWASIFHRLTSITSNVRLLGTPVPACMSAEIFEAMRHGGYTIFIRHSERDKQVENQTAFDRFAMRFEGGAHPTFKKGSCLTEEGRAEAWLLGKLFEKAESPIGTVYSSPICRSKETARLAFGRVDVINPNLNYQGTKTSYVSEGLITKEEKEVADGNFRKLIYAPPQSGTNKVIVAHGGQFGDVGGFGWQNFKLEESGILIIKHESENKVTPITRATLKELVYALGPPLKAPPPIHPS